MLTKTIDLSPDNRIPGRDIKDGEEFLWIKAATFRIYLATCARCEDCGTLGSVNDIAVQDDTMLENVRWTAKTPVSVGAYDADGSGACLCDTCALKRAAP